ncbi:hypothetical protein [Kibdelosporangium philippinense]|uniref:hypothetical protein n=1 Tax=Kibdelosporangium philippinense TaxID=211113 RepID=UPI00360B8892
MLVPFSSTMPDVTALRAVAAKLIPAAGRESRSQVPFRGPIARLADLVGRELVEFPGGHLGVTEHPSECALLVGQLAKPSRHEDHRGFQSSSLRA